MDWRWNKHDGFDDGLSSWITTVVSQCYEAGIKNRYLINFCVVIDRFQYRIHKIDGLCNLKSREISHLVIDISTGWIPFLNANAKIVRYYASKRRRANSSSKGEGFIPKGDESCSNHKVRLCYSPWCLDHWNVRNKRMVNLTKQIITRITIYWFVYTFGRISSITWFGEYIVTRIP